MTVVQPNSISGINSITVQSGEGLSIHKSDGSLIREIVSAAGIATYDGIKVGTAGTISNIGRGLCPLFIQICNQFRRCRNNRSDF